MRGQGTIYARGDALWVYLWSGGDRRLSVAKAAGKRPTQTTWKDAVDVLKKLNDRKTVAREQGSILLTPKIERLTVAELLKQYHAHRLIQGVKRPVDFACTIKALTTWWGHLSASRLTTEQLEQAIQGQLAKGFARGTIKTRLHGLYAALRWAKDRLPRIPDAPKVHVPLTPTTIWTTEDVDRLCAEARPWLADVVRFGHLTGWRINEVLGLTWDRVDAKRGLLFLDDTKTDDPRVRPIERAMVEILRRRTEARRLPCALVFHVDGLPVGDDRFHRAFRQACLAAGLGARRFHAFRNTAYDRLLLGGVNLFDAMDLIGHKSVSSARRYARPSLERMRAALERVEASGGIQARTPATHLTAAVVPISR